MKFLKNTKGSITILVTLILVPTIFFEGFMVDLARIKLYSNQAVMTADNYGEAVLSMYDGLLKELYGLFTITQDKKALAQLAALEEYMKSSFHPADHTISWEHLSGVQEYLGSKPSLSGFMPYQDADVSLSYEKIENSALSNGDILGSQIGDFMKFRIAMTLFESDDTILNALDIVSKSGKDSEAIQKRNKLSEEAEKVMDVTNEYYEILKKLYHYPEYIKNINQAYSLTKTQFSEIIETDSYKIYKDYIMNEKEIKAALKHKENLGDEEELSEKEQEYIDMYDNYEDNEDACKDKLSEKFELSVGIFVDSIDDEYVDFESFDDLVEQLMEKAFELEKKMESLKECRETLRETLKSSDVSDEIKEGMEKELADLDKLYETGGMYSAENYYKIAEYIGKNSICNAEYELQAENIYLRMEEIETAYIEVADKIPEWYASLLEGKYKDFMEISAYKKLYNSLKIAFESEEGAEAERKAKEKKKEAEKEQKKAEKELSTVEESSARNIPADFLMGDSKEGEKSDFSKLIENAASLFRSNSFAEAGNKLLIKMYTVAYDFGMFSSRVTNVKEGTETPKESLTGFQIASNINYLYQAELEYIFGGHNSSSANLQAAKNRILAFRSIANFTATYSVKEINGCIQGIASAASAVLPGLGIIVSGALRLAVAGIETVGDWEELKKGESVVVIKKDLGDLTSLEKFKSLIGLSKNESSSSSELKLDYEQYLLVLIVFLTTDNQLYERTGNLITLNVNTVQQKIKETEILSELKFKLEEAYTAVNATCSVHLDFAVMPNGFARQVLGEDTYAAIKSFEKNIYKFTVTRGY